MRYATLLLLVISTPVLGGEVAPMPRLHIDLTGYHTVKTAIQADTKPTKAITGPLIVGYIGVEIGTDKQGRVILEEIAPDSPAELAGLKAGSRIVKFNDEAVSTRAILKEKLRGIYADEPITFTIQTGESQKDIKVTPRAASKPFSSVPQVRVVLGVTSGEMKSGGGVVVDGVTTGGAGDKAGMKVGDVVLKIDETKLEGSTSIRETLDNKKPGDVVKLLISRNKEEQEIRVTLLADQTGPGGRTMGWDDRLPQAWKKPVYKLAIIGVEYPDVKHNAKINDEDWESSMFSLGKYTDKSATGQRVFGSMADYYREISYSQFTVEGKFVGWVEVGKKRLEYSSGSGTSTKEKTGLLTEAMDKVLAKQGKDSLKDYDGVFFIYAGERVQTTRGGLYWPHRASVSHNGKRWPYFIVQEGGAKMNDISVFCHEFGHMLGLPDLYARPEVPGMEGVGQWCAMSQQIGAGRPQHFSAWSKDQLGWLKPIAIDPRVKQKMILSPIEDAPNECVKILVRPDGSEYFLLENRRKKGFDTELPAEGLLIWRVLPNNREQRVFLEEAHGVEGQTGPRVFLGAVPFPSPANTSFAPYTIPSSKSQLGGGYDVYITNIRKLPDGRVTFHVGYQFQ